MYILNLLSSEKMVDPYADELDEHPEHVVLSERLRKSLYYGKAPGTERPSMPLTELAVEYFRDAAPKELGRVDMYFASNVGRKAYASPTSLMASMMYVRQLRNRNPEYVQQISSSELFLISMLVASKYLYDEGTDEEVYNDEWADAADMETKDINDLEREFLVAMDWNLFTSDDEFNRMLENIEATIAWNQGDRHGHFTYTDLLALSNKLLPGETIAEVVAELAKMMLVCSMAFFAGSMTLAATPYALHMACSQIPTFLMPQVPLLSTSDVPVSHLTVQTSLEWRPSEHWARKLGIDDKLIDGENGTEHSTSMDSTATSDFHSQESMGSSPQTGLQLASLVTITLLKETVTHFLQSMVTTAHHGLSTGHGLPQTPDELTPAEMGWKCQCRACPLKTSNQCHNVTIWDSENDYVADFEHSAWLRACRCEHKGTNQGGRESCHYGHTCCCCPYGTLLPPVGSMFPDVVIGFQTQAVAVG